jgi:hypothetical protein
MCRNILLGLRVADTIAMIKACCGRHQVYAYQLQASQSHKRNAAQKLGFNKKPQADLGLFFQEPWTAQYFSYLPVLTN